VPRLGLSDVLLDEVHEAEASEKRVEIFWHWVTNDSTLISIFIVLHTAQHGTTLSEVYPKSLFLRSRPETSTVQ
jgi:hypothetical protein